MAVKSQVGGGGGRGRRAHLNRSTVLCCFGRRTWGQGSWEVSFLNGGCRALKVVPEQVLIKHGLNFVLCGTSLLSQIFSLSKLTKDLKSGPLGAAASVVALRGVGRLSLG